MFSLMGFSFMLRRVCRLRRFPMSSSPLPFPALSLLRGHGFLCPFHGFFAAFRSGLRRRAGISLGSFSSISGP
ncbi:hypothetical protein SLA2020_258110 [Shorea laevis]